MTTVQVPRELLERALTNIHYSRRELGADESKTERDLRKVLAAPQVAAEPAAWVRESDLRWGGQFMAHGHHPDYRVPLYTHPQPAEPVNRQLLEALQTLLAYSDNEVAREQARAALQAALSALPKEQP